MTFTELASAPSGHELRIVGGSTLRVGGIDLRGR